MPDRPLRLFVAAMLPQVIQDQIRGAYREWAELRQQYRARPAAEYHFTLKFLGDVAPANAEQVADALEPAFRGVEPFHITLGSLGAFPTEDRASVLWWGVDQGADELTECAQRVEDAMEPLGFDREKRPYRPHLTLARMRPPVALTDWLAEKNQPSAAPTEHAPAFEPTTMTLVRSELTRQGARYHRMRVYDLNREAT